MSGILAQRGRSVLTMMGMAIGTASVVAVVSIGLVGREYVVGLIEGIGANLVLAYGNGEGINPEEVTFGDIEAFGEQVTEVAAMAPQLTGSEFVTIRGRPHAIGVLGVPPAYQQVRNLVIMAGRFITEVEETTGAKVCVVSRDLARKLWGSFDVTDRWLRIFNLRFRVVGVYREGVESAAAVRRSAAAGLAVIVPFSTFRNLSDVRWADVVFFQAASAEAVPRVVHSVYGVLRARHRNIENYTVESLDQYLTIVERISDAVSIGLIAIAAVSLLVGGIGIMNIMFVTVSERTQDIGIRLALGAPRKAILAQFLIEAAILSFTGGTLGALLGAGLPLYVGALYDATVPVSLVSVVVAFGVSVGVGLFFGFYPARKAANMNIVDALGYT
jgi:putative ABC transport system permease protein